MGGVYYSPASGAGSRAFEAVEPGLEAEWVRALFAPARKREILDSCRPPDVVVTDSADGAVSVGVCSPPSRLVTALRTRVAGLTALTAAPRTPVQTGSCPTAPHARPLHVVVDHLSRIHHFEANVDSAGRVSLGWRRTRPLPARTSDQCTVLPATRAHEWLRLPANPTDRINADSP